MQISLAGSWDSFECDTDELKFLVYELAEWQETKFVIIPQENEEAPITVEVCYPSDKKEQIVEARLEWGKKLYLEKFKTGCPFCRTTTTNPERTYFNMNSGVVEVGCQCPECHSVWEDHCLPNAIYYNPGG